MALKESSLYVACILTGITCHLINTSEFVVGGDHAQVLILKICTMTQDDTRSMSDVDSLALY